MTTNFEFAAKSFSLSTFAKVMSVASVAALVGCGGAPAGAGAEGEGAEKTETTGQAITVNDPGNVYFADVTANGTGCPAGTWNANISPDGQTFTVTFSQYETFLSPGQYIDVRDCQLGINLHTPQGLSYSISSFDYSGYASLDSSGMQGTQSAAYYFQGDRLDSSKGKTVLNGQYDGEYTYRDDVGIADLVWSRCGAQRLVNVATRLVIKNNPQKSGSGYMNTESVDGQLKLVFKLSWRSC